MPSRQNSWQAPHENATTARPELPAFTKNFSGLSCWAELNADMPCRSQRQRRCQRTMPTGPGSTLCYLCQIAVMPQIKTKGFSSCQAEATNLVVPVGVTGDDRN